MEPIRWGILGTGPMARGFALDLKTVPGADLRAVASRSEDRARRLASQMGAPNAHSTYADLFDDPDVDIVYIATPPSRHKDDTLAALAAGKHVLCEKPFTISAREAGEVARAATETKRFCMEAMWTRFMPAFVEARRTISNGSLGPLRAFKASLGYRTDPSEQPTRYDLALGGGALLDRGIYGVSAAHAFFGPPDCIKAVATIGESGVDEQVSLLLSWKDGKIGTISASFVSQESNEATVTGRDASLTFDHPFFAARSFRLTSASVPFAMNALWRRLPYHRRIENGVLRLGFGRRKVSPKREGYGYRYEAIEAMRCLWAGLTESPLMPLAESAAVLRTADAARGQIGLSYPTEQR